MSNLEKVKVVPVFSESGDAIGFRSKNLKVGDMVLISKNPVFLHYPIKGVIIAEDAWHFTAEIAGRDGCTFPLTLNKSSLYAKDPRYISEVVHIIRE